MSEDSLTRPNRKFEPYAGIDELAAQPIVMRGVHTGLSQQRPLQEMTVLTILSTAFISIPFQGFTTPRIGHERTATHRHSAIAQTKSAQFRKTPPACTIAADEDWAPVSPREGRVVLRPGVWSSRTGDLLREVADGVWVIERGYIWLGRFDVGGRSTVLRLEDGGLFVHSPLALTRELKTSLDALGPVRVVVAPNSEHVDFVAQWHKHYPAAVYLAPPGYIAEHPDIPFTDELSRTNAAHASYATSPIEQFFVYPAPFFSETVFVHKPSGFLIVTDLFWNYPAVDVPTSTRVWAFAMNRIFYPVYCNLLVKDRAALKKILAAILNTGFRGIIPCHGDLVTKNGQAVLREFFQGVLT